MVQVIGAFMRDVTSFTTFEAETLSLGSVNVHGIGVARCWCEWLRGRCGIGVATTWWESIEEACARGHRGTWVGMVGGWEIDTRYRGGSLRVVGLLMDLHLLFALLSVSPLSVKLDCFVLPYLEGGWYGVHCG